MATFTSSWTTGQSLHASSAIANESSATDDVNLATNGYYEIDVQIDLNIGSGTPNGDVTCEVFGSVDGGTNEDTIALTTRKVNFTATGNKKATISGIRVPYVAVKVANNTGESVTYVGRYAGLKQASA